jgi:hypothetical protein
LSKILSVMNVVLSSVVLVGLAYNIIESGKLTNKLITEVGQIEGRVILNLKQDFKTMKPETYQELMVKSDRIFSHVTFLAEKKYNGNIFHADLVDYADRAYDSVMSNMYENVFYKRLYDAGVKQFSVQPFEISSSGEYLYGEDVMHENGVFIRNKYHLEMKGESIYSRLKDIPAGIMLMNNDLLLYPKCEKGYRPFVIFGELYPSGGRTYGVNLYTENKGWRVSFKDIDILSDKALQNRLIFQTACQIIPGEEPLKDVDEPSVKDLSEEPLAVEVQPKDKGPL